MIKYFFSSWLFQLVVVVYVVVILWLVSSNFRSAAANAAASAQAASTRSIYRRFFDAVAGTFTGKRRSSHVEGDFRTKRSVRKQEFQICVSCHFPGLLPGSHEDQEDYYETEALLVVQDEKGKNKPRCTTYFEEECEGEPV